MKKSREAFRTISVVADWLDVPTHVLRFWESRFAQIKPVKRAGGRRYYRPNDMALIGGIKVLLHDDGLTIRGVQKLLREQGIKHVANHAPPLPGDGALVSEEPEVDEGVEAPAPTPPAPAARATHDAAPAPVEEAAAQQVEMFPDEPRPASVDVPDDPEDATTFDAPPRVAARLWAMPKDKLAAHRETLRDVASRLRQARDARAE